MENLVKALYIQWLTNLISDGRFSTGEYSMLMEKLYSIEFTWSMPIDINRAYDGVDLRTNFAQECGYSPEDIELYLGGPCTVLEMMVALAIRFETSIMIDLRVGPRVGRWFWNMIVSMHLDDMRNIIFDEGHVDFIVSGVLRHRYARNGEGGWCVVHKTSNIDMRSLDIWKQMSIFANEQMND